MITDEFTNEKRGGIPVLTVRDSETFLETRCPPIVNLSPVPLVIYDMSSL